MKKLSVIILAAVMAIGICGTALAATTVELTTATSGVSRVFWGPVFGTATGGASAFVVSGTILDSNPVTGATLFAISNTQDNATGTEMLAQVLNTGAWWDSGATPIGGPQLISGTSDTVVVYVQAAQNDTVADGTSNSGNTLYIINGGTGAAIYEIGLVGSGMATSLGTGSVFDNANGGLTPYSTAPVTIDDSLVATASAGATIYGVTGATNVQCAMCTAGVSVWAISAQTGTFATYGGVANSGLTAFVSGGQSGVSAVHAAPVISGNSLFIIGYSSVGAGNTIFQFVKENLTAGVSAEVTVNMNADNSDQWVPTPTVSGDSIFVVDNNGAVTAFRTDNLGSQYNVDYAGNSVDGGVTAGPVTNGTYIVLSATASVTNYLLDNLSGNSKQWTFDFGAQKSIWATPVISNGYVWVTVNDTAADSATTFRFTLSDTFDGDPQNVQSHSSQVYGSSIIVGGDLWTVTNNPLVEKTAADGASGNAYFPQFKYGAAKTGSNTAEAAAAAEAAASSDSSGCFISTIK